MAISEKASRLLFLLEIILVLPGLALLAVYAVGGAAFFVFGLGHIPVMLADRGLPAAGEALSYLGVLALLCLGLALAGGGAVALWKFISLARAFLRRGPASLAGMRRTFTTGLLWGAAPVLFMTAFAGIGLMSREHFSERLIGFYASGLPLLIPIAHLWLEMRYRGASGEKPEQTATVS